jgi:6-phosphogluconolactonase (cycloisomerase 2 family)
MLMAQHDERCLLFIGSYTGVQPDTGLYVYSFNTKSGALKQVLTFDSKAHDFYWSADIHVSPDGTFLYASNRREDENTIAIFSIDQSNGQLRLVGHQSTFGDHPRNFTLDPAGNFLLVANMLTNNIVVFKRDLKTDLLEKTKHEIKVPSPSCLVMRMYDH